MKRVRNFFLLSACAAALAATGVVANPLRWAASGDPQTMDPHSQNEGLTNSVNAQVYEFLMIRDKKLKFAPGLATEAKQIDPQRKIERLGMDEISLINDNYISPATTITFPH